MMTIIPSDKILPSRIKGLPSSENSKGKYVISENNEIKYVDENYIPTLFKQTPVISNFKIEKVDNNILSLSNGTIITPEINGRQYRMNIVGGDYDTSTITDIETSKLWSQPILTSNNSSDIMKVSASSEVMDEYGAWKAFDGTNTNSRDCWMSGIGMPGWFKIEFSIPIAIEKMLIQNQNTGDRKCVLMTAFQVYGLNDKNEWQMIIDVDGVNTKVVNQESNGWNEYTSNNMKTLFKAIRIDCIGCASGYQVSIGQIKIIGNYIGKRLPNAHYNLFVMGKNSSAETQIISSLSDSPIIKDGFDYASKIGFYETDEKANIKYHYPKYTWEEVYTNNKIMEESKDGQYIVYSDGWKIQYGYGEGDFSLMFDNVPYIVMPGDAVVTKNHISNVEDKRWYVEGI